MSAFRGIALKFLVRELRRWGRRDDLMSEQVVKTTSERFTDGGAIDLIRDAVSGELQLLAFDGKDYQVGQQIEYKGQQFALPDVPPSISKAMTLPSGHSDYGSTSNLFLSICKVLADRGIPAEAAFSATCWALSSWFSDVLPMAPCLSITGPEPEANLLLDLLGCLARRALPVIGTSGLALSSLPLELQLTLLVDCRSRAISKLLRTSGRHDIYLPRKDGVLAKFFFARAVYPGSEANDPFPADAALLLNLCPSRGKVPILTRQARAQITLTFQPQLLSCRLRHFREVEASTFDLPQFGSGIRILARIFGAPLVDAPELRNGLDSLLQKQEEKLADQRWRDRRCVAIEALLALCHDGGQRRVCMGELAESANQILAGRGETAALGPRAMGNILRESLGIYPKRSSKGWGIDLTEGIRRKIHLLARDFEVAAMQVGLPSCPDCREVLAKTDEGQPNDAMGAGLD